MVKHNCEKVLRANFISALAEGKPRSLYCLMIRRYLSAKKRDSWSICGYNCKPCWVLYTNFFSPNVHISEKYFLRQEISRLITFSTCLACQYPVFFTLLIPSHTFLPFFSSITTTTWGSITEFEIRAKPRYFIQLSLDNFNCLREEEKAKTT